MITCPPHELPGIATSFSIEIPCIEAIALIEAKKREGWRPLSMEVLRRQGAYRIVFAKTNTPTKPTQ